MDFLRMAQARGRYLGMELELIIAERGARPLPAAGPAVLRRGAVRPGRGPRRPDRRHPRLREVRPDGRRRGPPAHAGRRAWSSGRTAPGTSDVESGDTIHAEHVVNAGGLWAREVGRMVGHRAAGPGHGAHVPADRGHARGRRRTSRRPATRCRWRSTSPARSTSARRAGRCSWARTSRRACRGRRGETPWDFGSQLLKPDLDRITPELSVAFKHYPAMGTTGIKQVVNGPFTFSPDGNPLVGPIRGLRGYWVACGVMAGLSQGGGVGPRPRDLDDRRRPRRFRDGYLGDGRRPLRRLRDARLHEREGPGELPAPVPDHVPERGAARRPAAADDADPRPADRRQRGLGRDVRAGARAVVPAGRASSRRRTSPSAARTPGTASPRRSPPSASGSG